MKNSFKNFDGVKKKVFRKGVRDQNLTFFRLE